MKQILVVSFFMMIFSSQLWAQIGIMPSDSLLNVANIGPRTIEVDEDSYQQIRYVSQTTGSDTAGDGSKDSPWRTVISALLNISNESESNRYAILIASGIYDQGTIYMQEWIDLYGGFDPENWKRDLVKHKTILDGRGLRRVVIGQNNSRLDGFEIANGLSRSHGAGILCDDTSPKITNNVIVNNLALEPENFNRKRIHQEGNNGGGIASLFNAVPIIKNNLIAGNRTSAGTGAGIAFYGWLRLEGAPETWVEDNILKGGLRAVVENNVIIHNISGANDYSRTRSSSGGGISCAHEARPVIRNNVVIANEARGRSDAGGIYSEYYSYPKIEGNWILGNICDDDGGGIYTMKLGNPVIENNVIAGNWTHGGGAGGIRISKEGRATILANLIIYNPGGGVRCVDSYLKLEDNVILYNSGSSGFAYSNNFSYMGSGIIKNNIIRDNEKGAIEISTNNGPELVSENNNVDDDWKSKGKDNYDKIPLFREKSVIGKVIKIAVDMKTYTSTLTINAVSNINKDIEGKVIRIADDWGVIKSIENDTLKIWGLINSSDKESAAFEILSLYSYN